jgi:hypothetical protein
MLLESFTGTVSLQRSNDSLERKSVLMGDELDGQNGAPLGRPSKPVEEARSRRTVTFLTEGEYSKLVEISRRNNMSISALAHKLLIQSLNGWH